MMTQSGVPEQPSTVVIVISLKEAATRRASMELRLTRAGFDWQFLDAHRALAGGLTYDQRDAWIAKGRPLVPQELGCYSSHYAAWTRFLASDAQQLLVLEDDVDGDWQYVQEVLSRDLSSVGIHLLRLFGRYPASCRQRGTFGDIRIFQFSGMLEGGQAYVLTRHGAEVLVEFCRSVRRPIDDEMDRGWVHGVHSYGMLPYPIVELREPTQIPGRSVDYEKNPYRWHRLFHRINEQGRKLVNRAAQQRSYDGQIALNRLPCQIKRAGAPDLPRSTAAPAEITFADA